MAWGWKWIADITGPAGDAVAMGRFDGIDNRLDELDDQQIRTAITARDQLAILDTFGGKIVTVDNIHRDPHFEGTTPPNTQVLSDSAGETFEMRDAYGHLMFAVDDMRSNPHFRGSTGNAFTETHFILIAGQSNAVGVGTPSPVGSNNPLPNLFTIPQQGTQQGVEVRATDPLTHPYAGPVANSVGFGWTVARQYALNNPGVRVVVIGLAKSGSGFWAPSDPGYSWAPSRVNEAGITSLYLNAITRANAAIASYAGTKRVAMILWHQGEGDAVAGTTKANYEAEFVAMAAGYRSRITGAADAIVIVGQLGWEFRNTRQPGTWAQIDAAHQNIPALVKGSSFAPSPPQGHMAEDQTHFTGLGQKLLAQSMISVQQAAHYNL